uniref:PHD finger protein 12 isoform X2 n=1 Tax=Geotrypetes seraphini TaxID=260995 RepID=A0A6P8PPZ9_GEOSA|nr:PHD finger protein 12 isoform X2 [Geotrypetes seraphini]
MHCWKHTSGIRCSKKNKQTMVTSVQFYFFIFIFPLWGLRASGPLYNPPLSEEMLPPGEWICHRCTIRRKKREQKRELGQVNGLVDRSGRRTISPTSDMDLSDRTASSIRAFTQARILERRASRPGTPTSSASTETPNSEQNDMDEDLIDVDDESAAVEIDYGQPQLKRPFELLIAAAMERNPTQFQLPNELTCTTALPGTSKRRRKEETGKNVKKPQHELDHNGLVPLPVKVCFTCSRSCRVAPLIQCDYCPLLFHMDCLEPPLTAMPAGRWMCPNHMEHVVLNQKNMTLSNRCQVFDRFQDTISQHTVKVDFLNRIHKKHPPNRRVIQPVKRRTLKVPDAIKAQYQCPPSLLAPAGIRDGELVCNGTYDSQKHLLNAEHLSNDSEQQEWLRSVVALQCSILKHLSAKQMPLCGDSEKADIKPVITEDGFTPNSLQAIDKTLASSTLPTSCSSGTSSQNFPSSPSSPQSVLQEEGPYLENFKKIAPCGTSNGPMAAEIKVNGPHLYTVSPETSTQLTEAQRLMGPSTTLSVLSQQPSWPQPTTPAAIVLPNHTAGPFVKTENVMGAASCAQRNSLPGSGLPAPSPSSGTSLQTTSTLQRKGIGVQTFLGPPLPVIDSQPIGSPLTGTRALTPPQPACDSLLASVATSQRLRSTASDGKLSPSTLSIGSSIMAPSSFLSNPALMAELTSSLRALMAGSGELEISLLDDRLVKFLALQRIHQLFSSKTSSVAGCTSGHQPPQLGNHSQVQRKEVQARAVFYPLMVGAGVPVNMCYRTLYIGTGADMDVCLTSYGHCNYVSAKHACIFYDENTKHYELLNYSEHGTTVDNVLYSCDFSEKASPSPPSSIVAKVQSVIKRHKNRKQDEEPHEEAAMVAMMSSQAQGPHHRPCSCKASSSSLIGGSGAGWEGTALLHHGSYIKLGCLQFVFSISEFATKQPKGENGLAQDTELEEKLFMKPPYQVPVLRSHSVP